MGTVTQRNLSHVQAQLGGINPISMSEYYRGGLYVPSTRSNVREPASGYYYSDASPPLYYWQTEDIIGSSTLGYGEAWWNGTRVWYSSSGEATTSVTIGNITYYRGTLVTSITDTEVNRVYRWYNLYRITSSVNINTGVPSSGTISLNQLLGAENP